MERWSDGPGPRPNRMKVPRPVIAASIVMAFALAACGSATAPGPGEGSRSIQSDLGARAAITQYESTNGPPAGSWMITALEESSVDPAYALFRVGPTPGHEVQVGYGFAHERSGTWSVIGFGSAEVGCPPGASDNVVVPAAVLAGFDLTCPASG